MVAGAETARGQATTASQVVLPAVRWFQLTATSHMRTSRYVRASLCPARPDERWCEHAGFTTGRVASTGPTGRQSWHFNLPKRCTRASACRNSQHRTIPAKVWCQNQPTQLAGTRSIRLCWKTPPSSRHLSLLLVRRQLQAPLWPKVPEPRYSGFLCFKQQL